MVAEWKVREVEELSSMIKASKLVVVVGLEGVPAGYLHNLREELRERLAIRVSKNELIRRSLRVSGLSGMAERLEGPSALLFSNVLEPLQLYRLLKEKVSSAPLKAGSSAPCDIVVAKGDTGLPAGPVIGELQEVGIKARIERGKVYVGEDCKVLEKGQRVSAKLAAVLAKLGIKPVRIGLKLRAAHWGGLLFTPELLALSEGVEEELLRAHRDAISLSFGTGLLTPLTLPYMLDEAHKRAVTLGLARSLPVLGVLEALVQLAASQARLLSERLGK